MAQSWLSRVNWQAVSVGAVLLLALIGAVHKIDGDIASQSSMLEQKIDGVSNAQTPKFESIDRRIIKVEDAVKVLGEQQNNPTKQIIRELIAAAANSLPQKTEIATRALSVANSLLATLKKERQAADPQYFQTTIAAIDDLSHRIPATSPAEGNRGSELVKSVFSTRVSFAEYRSAIEPIPSLADLTWIEGDGVFFAASEVGLNYINTDFSGLGQKPGIKVIPPMKGLLSENISVKSAYIKAGYIYLDGIHWHNVTFIGSHIIYRGGGIWSY